MTIHLRSRRGNETLIHFRPLLSALIGVSLPRLLREILKQTDWLLR